MAASGSVGDLHPKAQSALKENLMPDEAVRVILLGVRRNAAMIATDSRIFIFKTGVAAGATFGSKFASFDYRNVSGVTLHTGAMTGSAVLDIAGAAPVGSSYWGNKNNDPWKAQNAIPIARPYEPAKTEIGKVRHLIAAWHDGQSRSGAVSGESKSSSSEDIVDQIKRLGDLRDQGVLTAEEFNTKKTELLKRL